MNKNQATDIAAYYWPAYHNGPRWRPFFRGNEGEWEIIRKARPQFDGHEQPRVPLWGYEDESDPTVMAKKIDAAVAHGVNVFIFDWYWYANEPFLESALNDGFLKAGNVDQIQFYLNWANHDAWSIWDIDQSHEMRTVWSGAIDRKTFDEISQRWINRYFKHPSYYKINGCPVLSIHLLVQFINGLGSEDAARQALDRFRGRVEAAGFPGVHLQTIVRTQGSFDGPLGPTPGTLKNLGFDSTTTYQFASLAPAGGNYAQWAGAAMDQYDRIAAALDCPFFPHVSIGWDTSPRYKAPRSDTVTGGSPEAFARCLARAGEFLDQRRIEPRLITINAWNEWSEGSYLEPDRKHGFAYLEAVRDQVFDNEERK